VIVAEKIKRLDALVENLGLEYIDDAPRQMLELKRRVKSLESVKYKSLSPLALECINELNKQIKTVSDTDR
jgi:hypothetical protein